MLELNKIYNQDCLEGFKKILMIGIAGSNNDFLLSLPSIKAYLMQFEEIKKEYEITIKNYFLDCNIYDIVRCTVEFEPDMICFSCYVWNMEKVKVVSSLIRSEIGAVKIVWGGPDISKSKHENGEYVGLPVDHLTFISDGEKSLYRFLLNGKEPPEQELKDYPSAYLTDSVPEEMFKIEGIRANIETQRGCNMKCSYCLYHKNFETIKYRKVEQVIGEFQYLSNKNIKSVRIVDANFFSHPQFAKDILNGLLDRNINMKILCEVNCSFITEELALLCRSFIGFNENNMITIALGLQSLNENSLRAVNRAGNIDLFNEKINLLSKNKVRLRLDIILGLPFENKDGYLNSLRFIINKMSLGNHFICPSVLKILPDTDMVEIAKQNEMEIDKRDNQYNILYTPTLPREHMIECLKFTTIAFKIFGSRDIEKDFRMKDIFFEIQSKLKIKRMSFLKGLVKLVEKELPEDSVFLGKEFIDPENYYLKDFHKELSDAKLIEMIKKAGNE